MKIESADCASETSTSKTSTLKNRISRCDKW